MSLLEDIFLQDEANEAQELERIIEGDEYEGRPRSDSDNDSEKEDEAVEDKRKVDPSSNKTRRVTKNPRFTLNPARLTGPRGIQVIPDHFKDFKFKGKGHEKEDLDLVLKKLEHWAYRLYPKFKFEDCLKKIETLGKKRPVMVHLHKIRTDQYLTEETVVQKDSSDEEEAPQDEFDKLLQQQIELARSTPAPNSARKGFDSILENKSSTMPKATSSPSISEEQRERMLRNRKLAQERRLARLQNNSVNTIQEQTTNGVTTDDSGISNSIGTKRRKSNPIESSDEEVAIVNESISADVHTTSKNHLNDIENENNTDNDKSINEKEKEVLPENDSNFVAIENSDKNIDNSNICIIDNDDGKKITNGNDSYEIISDNLNDNNVLSDRNIEKTNEIYKLDKNTSGNINIEENNHNTDNETTGEQENIELKNQLNSNNKSDQNENISDLIEHQINNVDGQNNKVIDNKLSSNDKANILENANIDDLMDIDFDDDF